MVGGSEAGSDGSDSSCGGVRKTAETSIDLGLNGAVVVNSEVLDAAEFW